MPKPTIDAVITVQITHVSGPAIDDPTHVLNYTVADGQSYGQHRGAITFGVCPDHPHPDDCDCDCANDATYAMQPTIADLDN